MFTGWDTGNSGHGKRSNRGNGTARPYLSLLAPVARVLRARNNALPVYHW